MRFFKGLTRKQSSSASAQRLVREQWYLKNGSALLEKLLALCDGNCRIPIRYFTATEIERATKHSQEIKLWESRFFSGSLENRLVFVRFFEESAPQECSKALCWDIAITAQMSHLKNVLRLVGCCLEFKHPVMVYEYVEAVTLRDLLFKKIPGASLSWGSRLRIANEIASAIVFLHSEFKTPIIYRDLKPSNVIIDQNSGVSKIGNFLLSIALPPGELQVEDAVMGTYGYADPQYMWSGIITQKSDVFSFGVVLFELLTGKEASTHVAVGLMRPYKEDFCSVKSIIEECKVMDILDPSILVEHGIGIRQQMEDYFDLVKKCTSPRGEDRPHMIDVAKEFRLIQKCFRALSPDSLRAA